MSHPTTQQKQQKQQKPCKALELLESGVSAILTSDDFKKALAFRAKFHNYSFTNIWLILAQNPQATLIAGFNAWKQKRRKVKKGEKGLYILAPLKRTIEEDGEKKQILLGFRDAYVFDVSQTEGEDIPETPKPELLESDTPEIRELIAKATDYAHAQGFTVEYKDTGRAKGYYRPATDEIAIRDDLKPLQTLKTLIHELAHGKMHKNTVSNNTVGEADTHILELEAESCAFVACQQLGLDTSSYSFAYLAGWSSEEGIKEVMTAANKGAEVAFEITESLGVKHDA